MTKLVIESTDPKDTAVDIEEKLEKAFSAIKSQNENKKFQDVYLKTQKDIADKVVSKVLSHMCDEIEKVLLEE